MTDANVAHTQVSAHDADNTLLIALLGSWDRRFISHPNAWRSIALFRSLNMAYAASQLPSGPDMTHYALGRSVGLWISAFEILAHPGENGVVGYRNIYGLLNNVEWRDPNLTVPTHDAYAGKDKTAPNSLPCWIYGDMFRARNDFMHGNPVALDRLVVQSSGQNLYNFAAPLYRALVSVFDPGCVKTQVPGLEDLSFDRCCTLGGPRHSGLLFRANITPGVRQRCAYPYRSVRGWLAMPDCRTGRRC
jgi:hypothetical protein